uniref:Pre-mRNA-splicing regulator WTAP n=1 Tax=Castor canadensis TaxID=51338 RepID=A0A8C0W1C7_CASCN
MQLATKEKRCKSVLLNPVPQEVQQPSAAQLRPTMVDPAINLFFPKMRGELEQTKDKLEQVQNELSAWKFKPDNFFFLFPSPCFRGLMPGTIPKMRPPSKNSLLEHVDT